MSVILGLDPGTTQTGWALYGTDKNVLCGSGVSDNDWMLSNLSEFPCDYCACEWITNRGMPMGQTTIETIFWIGRFYQVLDHYRIERREVQIHLCGSTKATDANVSQAIRNRFDPSGGGARPEVGIKKQPGPLYGIASDAWSALGVAITFAETKL